MSKILVMGPIYAETTVRVSTIPLQYEDMIENSFGILTNFSGHGYNVAKALTKLGDSVDFLSICGKDSIKIMMDHELNQAGISNEYVIPCLDKTPQTVVLYSDAYNKHIINDFKDSNEATYDANLFEKAINDCDTVIFSNVNYAKPFLKRAKELGKLIVSDVHAIKNIKEKESKEFMECADILFLNHTYLTKPYEEAMKEIEKEYGNKIIIMGMGEKGAMIYVKKDNFIGSFPTVRTRTIVNTVGAGDSQLSAFIHFYNKTGNPYYSLKAAILFASYKIGNPSASRGFLTEEQVEVFYHTIWK